MANRSKNEKSPYGPDVHLGRKIPPPEEPKFRRNKKLKFCKRGKGDHDFDFCEKDFHFFEYWPEGTRISVYLGYRCQNCGKKESLWHTINLETQDILDGLCWL